MGKVITLLTVLIFIDLMLIVTGQLCSDVCSLSSIIFNALINITSLPFTDFVTYLVGSITNLFSSGAGIFSLIVAGGVTLGALVTKSDTILFIPIAGTLALVGSDFVILFSKLSAQSPILSIFIMAPLTIVYYITVVDWLRGKD